MQRATPRKLRKPFILGDILASHTEAAQVQHKLGWVLGGGWSGGGEVTPHTCQLEGL